MDLAAQATALRLNQQWIEIAPNQWKSDKGLVHNCSVETCQFWFLNEKYEKVCAISNNILIVESTKKRHRQIQ